MNRNLLFPSLLAVSLLLPSVASACNVPVFRYALERWRTDRAEDRYEILVFHRGELNATEQEALAKLRAIGDDQETPANGDVEVVDLSGSVDPDLKKIWESQKDAVLPWVLVRYPNSDQERRPAFAGPLKSPLLTQLASSPARREIVRRMTTGDSVVWLLLESGDKEQDEAAAKLLGEQLRRLEKEIKLPDEEDDSVKLLSKLPLRVRFSILRVSRKDAQEAMLTTMLLRADTDFTKTTGPIVFPFFGRGRTLDGMAGDDLNAKTIETAATFLCGACSCIVKRLNPGVDLLVAADWDAVLEDRARIESEPPVVVGESVPIPKGLPATPSVIEPDTAYVTVFGVPRVVLFGAVGLSTLMGLVTAVLLVRHYSHQTPID